MTASMRTTQIAHLCSSGFVTNKIVLERVTDQKPSLLLLFSLPTGIAI